MKRLSFVTINIALILGIFLFFSCKKKSLESTFIKTFGGTSYDYAESVQLTSDGCYIIAGSTGSFGAGNADVYLIKTDSNGDLQWDKTFGGTNYDYDRSIQLTSDGGYIIVGLTCSFGSGDADVYLVKTDVNGNQQWYKTFGDTNFDVGSSVQQTSDGCYIIAGRTHSFGAGFSDVYLIKTDTNGNQEWYKTFGGLGGDDGNSILTTSDSGYIIAGSTSSFGAGEVDVYLIKTDAKGNQLWYKTFGGDSDDIAYSVEKTSDGGYIIAGYTSSFGAGDEDVYLIKTDGNGNQQWYKTFGGTGYDYSNSVQQTSDGGYIIVGTTQSFGVGVCNVYLIKTDANGNRQWYKTFGGKSINGGNYVQQTSDGGYIIAGHTHSFGAGGDDVYLIKTDANGNAE